MSATVVQAHVDFAQAVVRLAREHAMTGVRVDFRRSSIGMESEGPYETITLQWSEGRHGDTSQITLNYAAVQRISEVLAPAQASEREEK